MKISVCRRADLPRETRKRILACALMAAFLGSTILGVLANESSDQSLLHLFVMVLAIFSELALSAVGLGGESVVHAAVLLEIAGLLGGAVWAILTHLACRMKNA